MKKWIVLMLLFSQCAFAKWEAYFPAKLSDGVSIASRAGHGGFAVFKEGYAFRAKLTYTGEIRPLSIASQQVLTRFLGIDRDFALFGKQYGNEIRLTEEGKSYWMPVSFDVLTEMQKKLRKDDRFTAYVRLLGESGNRWIFLVDGFSPAP